MDNSTYVNSLFFHKLKLLGNKRVLDWCISVGLIASEYKCPKCSKPMKLKERKEGSDGFEWRCLYNGPNGHNVSRSIRSGSYFSSSRLSIIEILLVTYYWLHKVPNEFIMYELKTTTHTVCDWKNYCREICVDMCEKECIHVGGDESVVEVFEGKFGVRKNSRDNRVTGRWVYGGLMRKTFNFFFKVVDYPGKEVFLDVVDEFVLPHTTVISECWSLYKCVTDEKFKRLAKNHNLKFRGPDSGTNHFAKSNCTNLKRGAPKKVSKEERDISGFFIAEYFWQKKFGTDSIMSFLDYVKQIYPPETEDSVFARTEDKNDCESEQFPSTSNDIGTFNFEIDEEIEESEEESS